MLPSVREGYTNRAVANLRKAVQGWKLSGVSYQSSDGSLAVITGYYRIKKLFS